MGHSLIMSRATLIVGWGMAVAACVSSPLPLAAGMPDPLGVPDRALGVELERIAKEIGIAELARSGRASLMLVDLTAATPVYAEMAADTTLGAASIAKLAILLGAFAEAKAGKVEIAGTFEADLRRMIRASANPEASRAIRRVGYPAIAAALHDPRHALHDSVRGGLWVGRDFSGGKVWRVEPRSGEAHAASARSIARFFVLLDRGELVSAEASKKMRDILGVTEYDHKFVAGLRQAAVVAAPTPRQRVRRAAGVPALRAGKPVAVPGYRILRKSGSFGSWQGDSALIESEGRRYVLVCLLADRERGEGRLRRLAVAVDRLIARRHPASAAQRHPG